MLANPALPPDILKEAVPGNIRRAEHFVGFLKRFVEYLRTRMEIREVEVQGPTSFLSHMQSIVAIEGKTLRYKTKKPQDYPLAHWNCASLCMCLGCHQESMYFND